MKCSRKPRRAGSSKSHKSAKSSLPKGDEVEVLGTVDGRLELPWTSIDFA